jgi:hypothetical protein
MIEGQKKAAGNAVAAHSNSGCTQLAQQARTRTVCVDAVRDACVHALVLLVPLHILPDRLDRRHGQHKHQRRGGAHAAEGGDDAPPGQARLQQPGKPWEVLEVAE